jgi:hypothetical protein
MCSNDSPSQKRDGATEADESTTDLPEQLQSEYGDSIDQLRDTQLPRTRIEQLVTLCIDTQQQLDRHDRGNTEQTLTLVTAVAEAMADLERATVVPEDDLPESRAVESGVPVEEYILTAAERDDALDALSSLLFTAVETPPAPQTAAPEPAD